MGESSIAMFNCMGTLLVGMALKWPAIQIYFSFHQGLDPIAASGFSVSEWILKILSSTRALSESEELKSRNLQTFSKSHVRHVHLVAP